MSQPESPQQQEQSEPADPEDNFIQALIALSLVCCIATITLIALELNAEYGLTFGGLMSAPDQQVEQTDEESP